jgi:hypothetical protein
MSHGMMTKEEREFLNQAQAFLENPSLLLRMANAVGKPLDRGLKVLPAGVREKIQDAVQTSLKKGLEVVTKSIPAAPSGGSRADVGESNLNARKKGALHSLATFGTGAVGGFFGVAGLPIELPLTTGIMLRSIASIANDFGFDVGDREIQLECLYVLSLGGVKAVEGDTMDSAYWTSRLAFTDLIRHAARDLGKGTAPFLVRFLAQVAARFEIVVSEKVLAELVPVIGAVGGGFINAAFTDHFNSAARFHFGLRVLEKKYGEDVVKAAYRENGPS